MELEPNDKVDKVDQSAEIWIGPNGELIRPTQPLTASQSFADARREAKLVKQSMANMLEHILKCGDYMFIARWTVLKRGQFGPWLEKLSKAVGFQKNTLYAWQKIAERWHVLKAEQRQEIEATCKTYRALYQAVVRPKSRRPLRKRVRRAQVDDICEATERGQPCGEHARYRLKLCEEHVLDFITDWIHDDAEDEDLEIVAEALEQERALREELEPETTEAIPTKTEAAGEPEPEDVLPAASEPGMPDSPAAQ